MESYLVTYGLFFFTSVAFSILLNGLFLKFAATLGMRNTEESLIRWSAQTKPSLGGISFYVCFLLSIAAFPYLFGNHELLADTKFLGIVIACTLAFLMGLADDAYNTKPLLKFSIQILCGIVLMLSGIQIHIFPNVYANYLFTLFWVVGMMNSLNMLDNMDAITTTVSITIIIAALIISGYNNSFSNNIMIFVLVGILGALIGFLYFNWHPSKLFMGDTGSQFLGIFLASIGILYFWNSNDSNYQPVITKQFCVSILGFIIPICDTTIVVINRLRKGQSPFVGGKDHTTHHLSYLGLTDRQVSIVFGLISFISTLCTIFILFFIKDWGYFHVILFSLYFLGILFSLFYITNNTKAPNQAKR